MPLPSPEFETQALAKFVDMTREHLKEIGAELLQEISPELMDLTELLGECEGHPGANITIGGMASIGYRLCDIFKFTGKLGYEAITATKNTPAESSETGSVASLNEELATYQAHLGHIADQIIELNDSLLTFIPCDLTVLEGHPEITQAKDLLEIIKQIDDQFSAVSERIYEIGIAARQISQLESIDEEPELPIKKDRDWRAMTAMLAQCVEAAIQTGEQKEPSESKRVTKGRNPMNHPKQNDKGQPVKLKSPSVPSALDSWLDSSQTATATPCSEMPSSIVEIPVRRWSDAPNNAADWEALANSTDFIEPEFKVKSGKKPASGAVVCEADGRVWVVSPSNQFGGYANTFPKGKIESGKKLSLKATALKEVFEETGLKVELTDFLCDSERDTSTTRFYLAKRLGGDPSDMGWESQATHLVPLEQVNNLVTHKNDQPVLTALNEKIEQIKNEKNALFYKRIAKAKEIIRSTFPSIECDEIKYGFNTTLVYALLELASEVGQDDGWFQEAMNEVLWEHHNKSHIASESSQNDVADA